MSFIFLLMKVEKDPPCPFFNKTVVFLPANKKVINKVTVDKSAINSFSDRYSFRLLLSAKYKALINKWIVRLHTPKKCTFANYLSTSEK